METIASDVVPAPTLTPSIGSGNASAAVAAARRPVTPATSAQVGGAATSEAIAAAIPASPSTATGITIGSDRTVSAFRASGDQRNGGLRRHCLQRLFCGRLFAIPWELKLIELPSGGRSPEPARRWAFAEYDTERRQPIDPPPRPCPGSTIVCVDGTRLRSAAYPVR